MKESMKFALTFFAVSLLLGCHKQNTTVHNSLAGTWLFETNYPDGRKFESTITVGANGTYFGHINSLGHSNNFREFDIEGTWQIKDGFLIDTLTKHSQTNAKVPMVTRTRIVRSSDQELDVKIDDKQDPNFGHEAVFRKAKK
jgi:hypothetical protein